MNREGLLALYDANRHALTALARHCGGTAITIATPPGGGQVLLLTAAHDDGAPSTTTIIATLVYVASALDRGSIEPNQPTTPSEN